MKLTEKQIKQVLTASKNGVFKDKAGKVSVQAITKYVFDSVRPPIRRAVASVLDANGIARIQITKQRRSKNKIENVATLAETPMSLSPPFEGPVLDVEYVIADYELEKELAKLAKKGNAKAYAILMELIQA